MYMVLLQQVYPTAVMLARKQEPSTGLHTERHSRRVVYVKPRTHPSGTAA